MIGLWCGYGDEFSFRTEDINVGREREGEVEGEDTICRQLMVDSYK